MIATTIAQVALGAGAVWSLWETKASSEQFVHVHGGKPLQYNLAAILIPGALVLLFAIAMIAALRWNRLQHAGRIISVSAGLALAVVAGWWVALWQLNYNYYKLFATSGRLTPNEIMGSDWSLGVVMLLLSLAALLEVIPLVSLAILAYRKSLA